VVPDRFPSPFLQLQPTTVGGHRYPQIQFMTDTSASELNTNCDLNSGAGCVLPPQGPGHFFPYFTQEGYLSVPRTLKGVAVGGFSDAVLCRR
jgi:hypothetical protein